ncbi:MAG: hypothetical protein IT433_00150 [Phycisphaerales bacterium]|nr:hypothetical protein [Phycisphaerales bacterium]
MPLAAFLCGWMACAWGGALAWAQVNTEGVPSVAPARDAALEALRDVTLSDARRLKAARELVRRAEEPVVREVLGAELAKPLAGTGAGAMILRAVGEMPDAPLRLFPLLAQRLAEAPVDELPRLMQAVSSFHTRDAARLLVLHASPREAPEVSAAAFDGLVRLSGRADIPAEHGAWSAWLAECDQYSESQWRLTLAAAMARRADQLAAERQGAVTRLIDSYRRLHLATAPEQRSPLIAEFLGAETPEVRDLGFELAGRELTAGSTLGPAVAAAALSLTSASSPRVRAQAATLLWQMAPAETAPGLAGALAVERDPGAAGALLLACSRWPSRDLVTPSVAWLANGSGAAAAASTCVAAMARAALLTSGEQAEVLRLLRAWPDEALGPSSIWLLASLGDDGDLDRLAPLMESANASVRLAVAEALVWDERYTSALVNAARTEPDMFEVASRALLVHDPSLASMRTLLSLPQPEPAVARPLIERLAAALPTNDLWTLASELPDASLRRSMLVLLNADMRQMAAADREDQHAALAGSVLALADLQLASREPDGALLTIEHSPFALGGTAEPPLPVPEGLNRRHVEALVALNRLEQAASLDAKDAGAWIDGLALAADRPWAGAVLAEVEHRFGASLTPDQAARLASLRAKIAPAKTGPEPEKTPK